MKIRQKTLGGVSRGGKRKVKVRSVPDCPREGCRNVHAVRCWLKEKNGRGKRGKTKMDSAKECGHVFRKGKE